MNGKLIIFAKRPYIARTDTALFRILPMIKKETVCTSKAEGGGTTTTTTTTTTGARGGVVVKALRY